jgi:hypothetical protein
MVVHTCNPSIQEAKAGDCKSEASLGYIVRPYLKKPRTRDVAEWYSACPPCPNAGFDPKYYKKKKELKH